MTAIRESSPIFFVVFELIEVKRVFYHIKQVRNRKRIGITTDTGCF